MKRSPLKRTPFKRKPKSKKESKGLFDHLKQESKTEEWKRILNELKERFVKVGILSCELRLKGCTLASNFGWTWSFAHSLKRDKIASRKYFPEQREKEIREVVYACGNCHNIIEHLPKTEEESPEEQMYRIVLATINKRKIQP